MKRISYFENCELEYLVELGFWNKEKRRYTHNYWKINSAWKKIREKEKLFFLPKMISKILTAKYEKLVVYFRYFDNFIEQRISGDPKKKFIMQLTNIFKYSISKKDSLSEYKDIPCYNDKIADFFKRNAESFDITSCFYCETAYTGIYSRNSEIKRTFDIDHFFPQKQYPIFALSLYNFVPSCQVCNSRVKGRRKFKEMYKLGLTITNVDRYFLLRLSPTSPYYRFYENTKIRIYPALQKSYNKTWQYNDDIDMYEVQFDCDKDNPCQKIINAFCLNDRYNSTAIKSYAKYLENLKRKYPDSYIEIISIILNKSNENPSLFSSDEIKKAIFHKDNKHALLQKLRNDIIDYDVLMKCDYENKQN